MAGNASDIEVHFNPNADETPVEVTLRRRSSENSRTKTRSLCPKLFERASGSWWNPKFDSAIIEEQFQSISFAQIRRRFRYALCYILAVCVVWLIYLPIRNTVSPQSTFYCFNDDADDSGQQTWIVFEVAMAGLLVLCIVLLFFTVSHHYKKHFQKVSIVLGVTLCGLTLSTFASYSFGGARYTMSSVATFAVCIETILMMYTMIPMPYLYTVIPMLIFSAVYELLYFLYVDQASLSNSTVGHVCTKLFLHVCVHLMGTHVFFMAQVRSRNTFMKIGQAMIARHQHLMEKQLKETTIHSLMPDSIAQNLLLEKERSDTIFRTFFMDLMEDVSILFADIAGFTRMSANKSADTLVGLLNNLFGRFDILCLENRCEKICTLGDCYYCVAGCPEPQDDHAECCVNMGLSMIEAIKDFCQETGEKVNMRVGVHTGKVLCGVIGNRRLKFDVWSNDVTMANKMEASGIPGKVHVSAQTAAFLSDKYIMEESRVDRQAIFLGGKTYFITGLKEDPSANPQQSDGDVEMSAESPDEPLNPKQSASEEESTASHKEKGDEARGTSSQNGNHATSSKPLLGGEPKTDSRQNSPVWKRNSPGTRKAAAQETSAHLQIPGLIKGENGALGPSRTPSVRDLIAEHSTDGAPLPFNISLHNQPESNTDQDFVDCIKHEGTTDYFHKPPINNLTLTFYNRSIEALYRAQFRQDSSKEPRNVETGRKNRRHSSETISTAKYNTVFDVVVSFTVYLLISIGCFLVFKKQVHWLIIFPIAVVLQLLVLSAVLLQAFSKRRSGFHMVLSGFFHHWGPRNILGAILICLPVLAIYANLLCEPNAGPCTKQFFCFLIVVALLHFCNFIQLSSWMKTILAFLCAVVMLVLFIYNPCQKVGALNMPQNFNDSSIDYTEQDCIRDCTFQKELATEVVIDIMLLLILVLFLNREFEISYRLNFYGGVVAGQDKEKMQTEKEEAEALLHHIIPVFVTEQMRNTSKFSQNHENVAVIFCSIVNFIDFYEEAYQDGKQCIRVLHELICDFDNLLRMEEFKSVEKIKTIGPTYMAACGLHPPSPEDDGNPAKCLITMMEFATEMIKQVKFFNDEILSITSGAFEFIPRIGYNHGQLTSGVIGTTKLLYDIWGDTVNVASRMDSTGLAGNIQVTEHTKKALEPYYIFEYRGPVKVRGKGDMTTYLCKSKRETPLVTEECNSVPTSSNGPHSPTKETQHVPAS